MDFIWESGLPAGMHEIEIINRRRMRRAWEALFPPADSPANVKLREQLLTALELDELAFKDAVTLLAFIYSTVSPFLSVLTSGRRYSF